MNYKTIAFTALGLGGLSIALVNCDPQGIAAAFALIGWQGALALGVWRMIPVGLCVAGLWVLAPKGSGVGFPTALSARLGRDGVSALLPVLPAGGELVGARILSLSGVDAAVALGVLVADVTLEMAAQAAFSVVGVYALFLALPGSGAGLWAMWAVLLPVLMVFGLALMQHPRIVEKLESLAEKLVGDRLPAGEIIPAIKSIYTSQSKLAQCFGLHFAGWLVGVGEAWLALYWLGHPLSIAGVVALEAVVFALKGVAFVIPWSVGVQEGGYMALGVALGVPPDLALTLALVKRLPDVLLGVPGLIWWQMAEKDQARTDAITDSRLSGASVGAKR